MSDTKIFTRLSAVAIPVTDQERSKKLFEALGFECSLDAELREGFRWIELTPPGASTSLALVAAGPDLPTGVDTGIRLIATDARAARSELQALGCEVGELLDWETAPLMFSFRDPDGNRLYVSEAF
jgi:catechol 2,3-dioxygenase-like lactoylglutathione lyase family enzyme